MYRLGALAAAMLTLTACFPDEITNTNSETQNPSSPTGTVIGVINSGVTGGPLAGVTVSVQTAAGTFATATTSANGTYSVGGLTAGNTYNVKFSATGYVPMFDSATIPSAAGDFPANGVVTVNAVMAANTGTLSGTVRAVDGAPAAGVDVLVDLHGYGYDLQKIATTDLSGAYSFTGLPAQPWGVTVPVATTAWDVDADGVADYGVYETSAKLFPDLTTVLDFNITSAAVALADVTTNMESGELATTSSMQITFNRELDLTRTTATLTDNTASRTVAVDLTVDAATGTILTISPNDGTALGAFHTYSLAVTAYAPNGSSHAVNKYFQAVTSAPLLGPVAGLAVTPLANAVDYNRTTFSLTWAMVDGASGYQIWVRDNFGNPAWVRVTTASQSFSPSANITLPGSFDYFSWDGYTTPFLWGTDVEFAVVAVNAAGEAPLPDTATPVSRSDLVAPTTTLSLSGFLDNRGNSSSRTVTLTAPFSEFMDTDVAPAVPLAVPLASITYTYVWSADARTLTYSIVIPAGVNGAGTYTVAGWKDTSGNTMTSASVTELILNGSFETSSTALTGWTTGISAAATTTAPSIITSSYGGAYAARLGNTGTTTAQAGTSWMYYPVTLPAGAKSITLSGAYRIQSSIYYYYDDVSCSLQDGAGGALTTLWDPYFYYSMSSYSTFSAGISTSYGGQAARVYCQVYQSGPYATGAYMDNLSLIVVQ